MKAINFNFDKERTSPAPEVPLEREWLRVVGGSTAILFICVLWTFWV